MVAAKSRRFSGWQSTTLQIAALLVMRYALPASSGPVMGQVPGSGEAQAPSQPKFKSSADEGARQVTVFAILATPQQAAVDPRLAPVQAELRKLLPGYGFKLLDVQSKRLETAQRIHCDLGNGYRAETVLVRPADENGKVHLRCSLLRQGKKEFSTLVKTPITQLFFFERSLQDGSRVLIGVGARNALRVGSNPPAG